MTFPPPVAQAPNGSSPASVGIMINQEGSITFAALETQLSTIPTQST